MLMHQKICKDTELNVHVCSPSFLITGEMYANRGHSLFSPKGQQVKSAHGSEARKSIHCVFQVKNPKSKLSKFNVLYSIITLEIYFGFFLGIIMTSYLFCAKYIHQDFT